MKYKGKEIPPSGLYVEEENLFITDAGQVLANVHKRTSCRTEYCVIHNPSDHHMRDWQLFWREDRGFFERICKHGTGHPDPDDSGADPIHGCCGCCSSENI